MEGEEFEEKQQDAASERGPVSELTVRLPPHRTQGPGGFSEVKEGWE